LPVRGSSIRADLAGLRGEKLNSGTVQNITTLRHQIDRICAKIVLCECTKATEIRIFGSVTPSLQALIDAHYTSIEDVLREVVNNELNASS